MDLTEIERKALRGHGGASLLHGAVGMAPTIEPLGIPLAEAIRISGFSRSELYRRASRGEIVFRKCNARVLVEYASLKAAFEALPVAQLRIAAA
jgi:hypothetical protein